MKYRVIPVLAFALLLGFLGYRLFLVGEGQRPDMIPSALIGKPAPVFSLPALLDDVPPLSSADLKGKVVVVNFFASWCQPCAIEHPFLMSLKDRPDFLLAGINYKDANGPDWIRRLGNPYDAIGVDESGTAAIDFGVYGVPESYVIDRQGIVRYRHIGPITEKSWSETINPLIEELSQ